MHELPAVLPAIGQVPYPARNSTAALARRQYESRRRRLDRCRSLRGAEDVPIRCSPVSDWRVSAKIQVSGGVELLPPTLAMGLPLAWAIRQRDRQFCPAAARPHAGYDRSLRRLVHVDRRAGCDTVGGDHRHGLLPMSLVAAVGHPSMTARRRRFDCAIAARQALLATAGADHPKSVRRQAQPQARRQQGGAGLGAAWSAIGGIAGITQRPMSLLLVATSGPTAP